MGAHVLEISFFALKKLATATQALAHKEVAVLTFDSHVFIFCDVMNDSNETQSV